MASFRKEVGEGVFWIALAKYSGLIVQLIITAVLARIIAPSDFGTIALAMVILHFLNILSDIGLGPAIVQYKQLKKNDLDNIFTFTIYIGIVMASVMIVASDVIASYYNDFSLARVCKIMSLVSLFHAMNIVPNSQMRKYLRFRAIAIRTLVFQIIGGAIAIWGAIHGWGLYALLVSPILTAVGVFVFNFVNYPQRIILKIDMKPLRMVFSFSIYQFGFELVNYFSRNLDKLIIGKYFSMAQLGYYEKSYHLMVLPLQNVTRVISPVLHPVLSTLNNNNRELQEKSIKLARLISRISFPIGLSLFFCGGELIKIVYGNKWDAAIPVFRILALSLPLQMIQSTSGAFYQAAGKTNHFFYNGISNTCCTVTGFFIAAIKGGNIESMAWAWDVTLLVNFIITYTVQNKITLKGNLWPFVKALLPQLFNTIVVCVIVVALLAVVPHYNVFISLIWKISAVIMLTLAVAFLLNQYNMLYILKQIYKRK